jgi:hypothetical protein
MPRTAAVTGGTDGPRQLPLEGSKDRASLTGGAGISAARTQLPLLSVHKCLAVLAYNLKAPLRDSFIVFILEMMSFTVTSENSHIQKA